MKPRWWHSTRKQDRLWFEHIQEPTTMPAHWDPEFKQLQKAYEEHITVDQETGGKKGQKIARFDLIPGGPLWQLAEHYGKGAQKYGDSNWRLGYKWSLNFAAMMRHAWAWWRGEDIDPETGSNHLVAVAWHAFALLEFTQTHPEKDDRPKYLPFVEWQKIIDSYPTR